MTIEKITSTPTALGVVDKVNEIIDSLSTQGSGSEIVISEDQPENAMLWFYTKNIVAVSGTGSVVSSTEPTTGAMLWFEVKE